MRRKLPFAVPALVVSCQAREDNPLHGPAFMAAMARAAEQGGAAAIRANGRADVAAIVAATRLPVIGINKIPRRDTEIVITPDFAAAEAVAKAGAAMIALDGTRRHRPRESLETLIGRVHDELRLPVMADVATLADGLAAERAGADCVATTLAGYTAESPPTGGPDFGVLRDLTARLAVPVIAEGRFWSPGEVAQALSLGAAAVVIGTAITNPREITKRFAAAMPK